MEVDRGSRDEMSTAGVAVVSHQAKLDSILQPQHLFCLYRSDEGKYWFPADAARKEVDFGSKQAIEVEKLFRSRTDVGGSPKLLATAKPLLLPTIYLYPVTKAK
ncbi:hypothetical protein LTR17_003594 [Elasticomyces elasticus]|nr:hypothetical protein LTR17_003594 [Elasticomyces elasticus]